MAKKAAGGVNKSKVIRDFANKNSSATPKEIVAKLAEQGLELTPQFVSTVLSNARRKEGKPAKRGRGRGRPAGTTKTALAGVEGIIQAKKFAEKLGGVDAAKAALDALSQILG